MSRQSFKVAFITASLVMMPLVTHAALTPGNTGLSRAAEGTGLTTSCTGSACLLTVIGNVINLILGFLGVVLLVMLLYAGFLWMTSGGDTKGVQAAKTMISNAVAGVIIVAVSYAITAFVLGQLGTITEEGGGGEAPAVESAGRACRRNSDCPTTSCPGGAPLAGLCVSGECSEADCAR